MTPRIQIGIYSLNSNGLKHGKGNIQIIIVPSLGDLEIRIEMYNHKDGKRLGLQQCQVFNISRNLVRPEETSGKMTETNQYKQMTRF